MKKSIYLATFRPLAACLLLLLTVILLLPLQGCHDEFRHNKRYAGDWKFKCVVLQSPFADTNVKWTWEYNGHIYRGNEDEMHFHMLPDQIVTLNIDEDGQIVGGLHFFDGDVPVGGFSDRKHLAYTASSYNYQTLKEFERIKVTAEPR